MAKKKPRGMPFKTCIKCGAKMHARKGTCPKCNAEQPTPEKPEAKAQPVAAKRGRRATTKPQPGSGLPQAVSFVREVGGLDQAKKLLGQIEEIKRL
jgi:predicted ATP-dependent serine protease